MSEPKWQATQDPGWARLFAGERVTSSRRVQCPKCKGWRFSSDGPHAPRIVAGGGQVDCSGDPVLRPALESGLFPCVLVDVEPPRAPTPDPDLQRVTERIGVAITGFFLVRPAGATFHADELRQAVTAACGQVAPGSSDRVMRALRQEQVINYRCADRAASLYEVLDAE